MPTQSLIHIVLDEKISKLARFLIRNMLKLLVVWASTIATVGPGNLNRLLLGDRATRLAIGGA